MSPPPEMMEADEPVSEEVVEYPGLEFTPPQGTVDDGVMEGEALVKWKKVGDRYTLVEFEGQPLAVAEAALEPPSSLDELKMMEPGA